MLTILWRVCCLLILAIAHLRIWAKQSTAMMKLTVKKDRKKRAV